MTQEEQWLLKEKWHGQKTEGFLADCERLKTGEPLAYIIGHISFLNTKIFLDSHPLIPRTETEFWVEKIIAKIKAHTGPTCVRILDLCAGSGCIGVAVLARVPHACVDFVEIDTGHHATILKNITENGIDPARAQILGGNLFEKCSGTYDFILTNPPYIDSALDRTEESVKKFEPEIALYGGELGMELIENIIERAPGFLSDSGILIIEHEPEQCDAITTKAHSVGFRGDTFPDQYGILRYTLLSRTHV